MYKPGDLVWLDVEPGVVTERTSAWLSVRRVGREVDTMEPTRPLKHITNAEAVTLAEAMTGARWYPHHGAQGGSLCDTDSDAHSLLARWRGEAWDVYSADGTVVSGTAGGVAAASAEVVRLCIEGTIKPAEGWGKAKQPATTSSLPTVPLRVGERITEVTTSDGRRFRLTSAWEEC